MKLRFPDDVEAFRNKFSSWLDANSPTASQATVRAKSSSDSPQWARNFQRAMFEAGWLLPGQPPEFGGRNASLIKQFVHQEELTRRRIYHSFNPQGLGIVAPSILMFGTPEQKQRWAVPVLRGDMTASLGMSEPEAGSDLAGLRTRAEMIDSGFVVNGQKVWTSGAQHADYLLAFVRTDPAALKHRGISALLIPTTAPGLTRRPFGSIVSPDDQDFNEVFFDDVHVPAENLVGELHGGWRVVTGALGEERAMLWLTQSERLDDLVDHLRDHVRGTPLADDSVLHDWYGRLVMDSYALRLLGYRTLAKMNRGVDPSEQSILKLFGSEAWQNSSGDVLEAFGTDSLDQTIRTAPFNHLANEDFTASWFERYLRSFAATIAGGTSEIQRNIVAERVLGLPR